MLPEALAGWNVRYVADGLALTPPDGGTGGGIRIRERLPLQTSAAVVASARTQMAGFERVDVSDVERFTTAEGEYAALWRMTGSRGALRFERTVGLVWGDVACTRIDGGTDDAARFDEYRRAVRALCYYHALGLGERRRRRFVFAPPRGWQGYARGLIGLWIPPGYPNDSRIIHVFPARPIGRRTLTTELNRHLHEISWTGFHADIVDEPVHIDNDDGLTGVSQRVVGSFGAGSLRSVDVAVLHDGRYHYPARFDCDDDGDRSVFAELMRSVEKLPIPEVEDRDALFSHWTV